MGSSNAMNELPDGLPATPHIAADLAGAESPREVWRSNRGQQTFACPFRHPAGCSRPVRVFPTRPAIALIGLLLLTVNLHAGDLTLSSPDGKIALRIPPRSSASAVQRMEFEVAFQGRTLFRCEPALSFREGDFFADARESGSRVRESDSTWTMPFGKSNPVRDRFHEMTVEFERTTGPVRKVHVIFRAYDDGVAFRYLIPEQSGLESIEITDEANRFRFEGNPRAWPLYLENHTTSHEGRYVDTQLSELVTNRLIDLPLLLEYEGGASVALTEANLRNYAGMYLKSETDGSRRQLRCDLSPLPGQGDIKVRSRLPLSSPWRVVLIGPFPGRFIESNLVLNLNEPNAIGDASWLKAGKTTWYWWNGPYQEAVDFHVGFNWETMRHYIDFCARNGIAFHSVVSTEDGYPWYFQTDRGYSPPGRDADITRVRGDFPMDRVVEYARARGVGIRLWVHWKPLSEHLEEAFTQYERWGIRGLMVDFLDRDDQEMVRFAERVLESAARHHLHIHFHGVWKPTGLQRTYPNLFNHEGVLNLEYLKWGDQCDPEHNLTVPFTRMIAGPMDYHLGGFRSVRREQFKPVFEKPVVLGTRCHHLAMYVVYENPMPMVSDAPTAYEGQPGFDFIRQVPVTWDETRVLSGRVGDSIVVARRHGADWFLGAMTDWTPRELEVSLAFLPRGRYRVDTWTDAADSRDPNQLVYRSRTMTPNSTLRLRLGSGGGAAIRIQPRNR
jgi:alpha-glucosidase